MSAALERARAACAQPIVYKLGKGGFQPLRESPAGTDSQCDCSGFVSWCLGVSRETKDPFYKQLNGGWIETTAVVADAIAVRGLFTKVDVPEPGDVAVWGDSRKNGKTVQGHIGIVAAVENGRAMRVIHCSSGNFKRLGKAVQETSADIFHNNNAIYARYTPAGG
jgi:hypothetical protein